MPRWKPVGPAAVTVNGRFVPSASISVIVPCGEAAIVVLEVHVLLDRHEPVRCAVVVLLFGLATDFEEAVAAFFLVHHEQRVARPVRRVIVIGSQVMNICLIFRPPRGSPGIGLPTPGRRPQEWSRIEIQWSAVISVRVPSTSTQPVATPIW